MFDIWNSLDLVLFLEFWICCLRFVREILVSRVLFFKFYFILRGCWSLTVWVFKEMGEDYFEIKFRLHDGTDIGPRKYSTATTIATLKESIIAQWPKEKENGPKTINDVKLINAGKILENIKTLGECRGPICDVLGGIVTMHVVLRPPVPDKGSEKQLSDSAKANKCMCRII